MSLFSQSAMNYLNYYNLEDYLFTEVTKAFRDRGYLTPEEFFSIVIWKANRAKGRIKAKLTKGREDLGTAVKDLTTSSICFAALSVGWLQIIHNRAQRHGQAVRVSLGFGLPLPVVIKLRKLPLM